MVIAFCRSALSSRFTEPLGRMKYAAWRISEGDFSVRTGIGQPDEIGELAGAMDSMAAQLGAALEQRERLERLRREFLANVSHELRTPVTVIRASLEALNDGVVEEPGAVKDYHAQMLLEIRHLERLVTDLLELARLQNPDFQIEMQAVELSDVVQDAARSIRRVAEAKGVRVAVDADAWFELTGDYGRLHQMLLIALDNAVKFSPEGGEVQLSLDARNGGGAIVSVRDHQHRIPECLENRYAIAYYARSRFSLI